MKLSLNGIFASLAVMLFVACNDKPTPPIPDEPKHENLEFKFENKSVSHTELSVDISPMDKDMEYVICLSQPRYFQQNGIDTREELLNDDYLYFASLAAQYNLSIEEFLTKIGWLVKGDKENYNAINLYPDTEYVVYCYGVKFNGDNIEATTPVNYEVIKTSTPAMIDVKFDVKCNVENNDVKIDVDPQGYTGYYYSYVVPEGHSLFIYDKEEFTSDKLEHYRNATYNEFNRLINELGTPVDQFCHKGKTTIEQSLTPETTYQIALFAVSDDKMPILCSMPVIQYFTTEGVAMSDMSIELSVTDITSYTAQLTVTPSNNDEEYACVFLKREQVPQFGDEHDTMMSIIRNFQPAIFKGEWSEQLIPLMPASEYTVLAFGINNDYPTTSLYRYDFTSADAGESKIKIESIDLLKLFDAEEIVALDASYAKELAECECVAIVEMKTTAPADATYFYWYEEWMKDEYSDEAFLEDLLLYPPGENPETMGMFYSIDKSDRFLFAGIAEDDEGNLCPIYYGEPFTLEKEQCDPAEEFFTYVGTRSANRFIITR